jgi:hypothetical protein
LWYIYAGQKKEWKAHKMVCRIHKSDESDNTIVECLWNEYNLLKTALEQDNLIHQQYPNYDMSTFPTKEEIHDAAVVNLSAGEYAPEHMKLSTLASTASTPAEFASLRELIASSPDVVERTLIKLLENIINEMPVEIHEEKKKKLQESMERAGLTASEKELWDAVEACHPLDQKAHPTCPHWNGSMEASRQTLEVLPQRDSRLLGATVIATFCTNGELESTSGLMMWRLITATEQVCAYCSARNLEGCHACGMGQKFLDVGLCVGRPKQTVCEKMLFWYMVHRRFKMCHVVFAHRWGEEIATAVGSILETFDITWEFQNYEAAVLSATSNGNDNHPMGLQYLRTSNNNNRE